MYHATYHVPPAGHLGLYEQRDQERVDRANINHYKLISACELSHLNELICREWWSCPDRCRYGGYWAIRSAVLQCYGTGSLVSLANGESTRCTKSDRGGKNRCSCDDPCRF